MGSNGQGEMSHIEKRRECIQEENTQEGPDGGGEESVGMHTCKHA